MTAVQTCSEPAPRAMNSAASRQEAMPPMPEIGIFTAGSAATAETRWRAIGLTAGPQYPPWLDFPATEGCGSKVDRSTPTIELIVLMSDSASAPPLTAARAMYVISVTFGVSLTITGIVATSFTHSTIWQV